MSIEDAAWSPTKQETTTKTASDEFTEQVQRFINNVSPDLRCPVCRSEDFIAVEEWPGGHKPAAPGLRASDGNIIYWNQYLLVCERCGNTLSFSKDPIRRWLAERGEPLK